MESGDVESTLILTAASAVGMLGSGPDTAYRLLNILCRDSSGLREVVSLIIRDPGLTARVLKVANSSFYGHSRGVETIDRAVAVLGLDAVRGIAAAACIDRALPAGASASLQDIYRLVRHSVATALAAEQLAHIRVQQLAGEAFIAGLLHDLGVVVQARLDPLGFRNMIEELRLDPTQDMAEVERRCVSTSRQRCAHVVFSHWQLPESLIQAICHLREPDAAAANYRPLAALVHAGNFASLIAQENFSAEPASGRCNAEARALIEMTDQDLHKVVETLSARTGAFLAETL